jgi:hypothetical protein
MKKSVIALVSAGLVCAVFLSSRTGASTRQEPAAGTAQLWQVGQCYRVFPRIATSSTSSKFSNRPLDSGFASSPIPRPPWRLAHVRRPHCG